jgi:hypothetical protein
MFDGWMISLEPAIVDFKCEIMLCSQLWWRASATARGPSLALPTARGSFVSCTGAMLLCRHLTVAGPTTSSELAEGGVNRPGGDGSHPPAAPATPWRKETLEISGKSFPPPPSPGIWRGPPFPGGWEE